MKRRMTCFGVLLLAGTLVSCGGGDSPSTASPAITNGGNPGNGTNPEGNGGGSVATPGRVEESDAAVSLSPGGWTPTDPNFAWSGGTAMQSKVIGATATFTFTGSSVRWIGGRNDNGGIALVSVDGGPGKRVDTFARPYEIHTPMVTIDGLSAGRHTLTIKVTGERNSEAHAGNEAMVMVDAFDVDPPIVSHLQETDPNVVYGGSWTHDDNVHWSGGGVRSAPHAAVGGARFATTAGSKVTLTFRGTSITWQSGRSFDFGIALVTLDGAPTEVDTYAPAAKFQEVVFAATGLADAKHTLTIEATGRKNPASSGTKIVVDAFDVSLLGRRVQEDDPAIHYSGSWTRHNVNRVWNEGACNTSQVAGSRADFTFTGSSVSWIGCQKESCGGVARVSIDGAFVKEIHNFRPEPIEAFQNETFRADGLSPGQHTLTIQQMINGSYIVVDAFDVRP
ncbi:MAG TPA: hypothetical protein VGF58_12885 [Burkholderiales bacterium]|jgi:hypothetical protein